MKDTLLIGMMLGIIVGATLVTTNDQAKKIAEKGKKVVKKQLEKLNS